MSRNEEIPPDERSQRTIDTEVALQSSLKAEARAQEAKSIASRAMPKRGMAFLMMLVAGASAALSIITATWWVSQLVTSKADAKTVTAVEARADAFEKKQAVFDAVFGEFRDDVKELRRQMNWLVRQRGGEDKERGGGHR